MTLHSTSARVRWVDVAKGLAILLVVLHHAIFFADARGWVPLWLVSADNELATFRMPLFFLVSGLFAASSLSSSWTVVLRKRIALYAWVYFLWLVIRYSFFAFVLNPTEPAEGHDASRLLTGLILPSTGLWFIFALLVFSLVGKLMWRVPVALQLGSAAVLAVLADSYVLPIDNYAWRRMAMYLVFFLAGAHLSRMIRSLAASSTIPRAMAAVAAFAGVSAFTQLAGLEHRWGLTLIASVLAVAAGSTVAVVIAGSTVGRGLFTLGSRTLDVYLPHVMVIGGLSAAAASVGFDPSASIVGVLAVMLLTVLAVGVSLLLARLLRRAGAGWLFVLPRAWSYPALDTAATATTGSPGSVAVTDLGRTAS